jgi:hypothetical protein
MSTGPNHALQPTEQNHFIAPWGDASFLKGFRFGALGMAWLVCRS